VADVLSLSSRPGMISFAGGLPAPELFDVDGIAAAFARVLSDSPERALQYSSVRGDPLLRAAVAGRLTDSGLPTAPEELLITTGSQQALALLVAGLLEPGDTVLVEEPTYLAALQRFAAASVRAVPVPCDDHGTDPAAMEELAVRHRPKALYVIPTFQNPTGRTMPLARRQAVAAVAERHGLLVVEDDPYAELRYEGIPLPSLAAMLEGRGRSALLGSFSKIMAPGLRLGWLRAPAEVLRICEAVKESTDVHTSSVDQAAAAHYLTERGLSGHLEKLRTAYRARRDRMLSGLAEALPPGSTHTSPEGGMFVWVRLPGGQDAAELLRRAVAQDVAFVPGAPFYAGEPDRGTLRLSFTTCSPERIEEGLRRIRRAHASRIPAGP